MMNHARDHPIMRDLRHEGMNPMTDLPTTYGECEKLANDAVRSIANALIAHANHSHWGDDCGDYFNALVDQLRWLSEVMVDTDTDLTVIPNFTWLLTASRDAIETPPDDAPSESRATYPGGWIYGYADHNTAISDAMRANNEDED